MEERRTDEQLVEAFLSGEDNAFTILVSRYHIKLFNIAYQKLQQTQDAEDAVQITWLGAWQNIRLYPPTRKFSSWLYSICRNKCYDAIRLRHHKFDRLPKDLDTITSNSLREMACNKESRTWCLAVLNRRQHLLYDAIMVKGMNYEQVLYEVKELCPVEKGCVLEVKPERIEKLRLEFCEIMEIVAERAKERLRRDKIDKEKTNEE
jgi:RNA polymerase sigma-70 factor (ECF subfamily)